MSPVSTLGVSCRLACFFVASSMRSSVPLSLSRYCTDHIEDIVTAAFQYLAMVRREGPQEWIFKECGVRG